MNHRRRVPAEVTAEADLIGPHLLSLVQALRACENQVRGRTDSASDEDVNGRTRATYLHLFEDLEEIAYLIKIGNRSVRDGARLAPQVREIRERPGRQSYKVGSREAEIFAQSREVRTEVLVVNKAVHEWFNHVSVALKLDQRFMATIHPELLRKLAYVVLIRDKLLTHKKDLRTLGSGASFYENLATARVSRLPFTLPDEVIAEINGIFKGSLNELPENHRNEENVYQQFGLLTEFHDDLQNHYKMRIKSLVEQYGAECSSLEELAILAKQFAEQVLVPLSGEIARV